MVWRVANKSARKLRGNWSQWNLSFTSREAVLKNCSLCGGHLEDKIRCNSQSDSVCLSVCPSVRHFVTFLYCVQTNEDYKDTIVWFTAFGRTILLVSEKVKFIWIFTGDHPQRGR